jgi:predicted transcriptional regulator of viral defense system
MRQPQSDTPGVWDVHGIQVEIVIVVPKHFFGFQTIWLGNSQLQIFDQERALLDCFALPRRFGGLVEGLAIVEQHIHRLDLSKLADYSIQYGKASVSKRIGFALEQYAPTHPVVEKFRNIPIQGMRPLDPTRPTRGKRNKRWGLVENLGEP